jgi:hypothetical protein
MGTALRPPGRPPIRRNAAPLRPRLAEMAAGIPGIPGANEPAPTGLSLGGQRTGPALPAPGPMGAAPQMMLAMRQALARAIAARQKGVRRG